MGDSSTKEKAKGKAKARVTKRKAPDAADAAEKAKGKASRALPKANAAPGPLAAARKPRVIPPDPPDSDEDE